MNPTTVTDVARLYGRFLADPGAVDAAWRDVFARLDVEAQLWLQHELDRSAGVLDDACMAAARDSVRALMLVRAYRVRGHLEADLDPLHLSPPPHHPELDPATFGFEGADLDRPVFVGGVLGMQNSTVREIVERVRAIYCGTVGVEFMHMQDPERKAWVQRWFEDERPRTPLTPERRREVLAELTAAETFERFLDTRFKGTKRFGLDGGESTLPALEALVRTAASLGVEEVVIGMSHRGRLNVMANLLGKPLRAILHEFEGGSPIPDSVCGSGDVKYHLGTSTDREIDGRRVHLSLAPNPSHLEAVDPVVVGKVRARQDQAGDAERRRVMGVLLHGDAAFAGQGVVAETLQMSELDGYRAGGIVHVIVNNQIGFTTCPAAARTSPYCSDFARAVQAPVVHVNGDDPDAVVQVAEFAARYRQAFGADVVVDLVCYRRHGHNEGDEPAFTQPRMYAVIRSHPGTRELYARRLAEEGVVDAAQAERMVADYRAHCDREFEASKTYAPAAADWLDGAWAGLSPPERAPAADPDTGVDDDAWAAVTAALCTVPEGFALNPKIARGIERRRRALESGEGIDWASAEAMAFGTLLREGHPVRLSGEDVGRGTFSQRHAVWVDAETEARHVPLSAVVPGGAPVEIVDSPLSEYGVLGFEYGYAMARPEALVLWEAQFGDFANGAQVIIDQFVASGEAKWLRMNGLVLLLPHGYEGQGPEHSSARLERFLQLCGEDNIQVVSCTTPANFFHALRRQLHRPWRKPLVVMAPKSLLRHPRCVSPRAAFAPGTTFERVVADADAPTPPERARQVVLCSGKVYYDLAAERERRGAGDVHLVRLEQLYPFPEAALASVLQAYRHCALVWCQEEPRNMGAWSFVREFLPEVATRAGVRDPEPRYAGRPAAAAPATGVHRVHVAEQARLVDEALRTDVPRRGRIAARREAAASVD